MIVTPSSLSTLSPADVKIIAKSAHVTTLLSSVTMTAANVIARGEHYDSRASERAGR